MRRAIVTGGGHRLGAAIVRALAGSGFAVVVHYNGSGDEARALAAELSTADRPVAALGADFENADEAAGLVELARGLIGGPIDTLVNNASIFEYDRLPVSDYDRLTHHMKINLGAPVVLASALAGQRDLDRGSIVNILDQKVGNLNPDFFSYTCSKSALEAATHMMAQALAPRIRVNAVSPGLCFPSLDQSEAEFESVASENLLRRRVAYTDVAEAVLHLVRNEALTGLNLFADNGQRFLRRDGDVMFRDRAHRPDE